MSKKKKVVLPLEVIKRRKYNFRIINALTEIAIKYPELRFQQILQGYNIIENGVDKFYEESEETFTKLVIEIENKIRNEHSKVRR